MVGAVLASGGRGSATPSREADVHLARLLRLVVDNNLLTHCSSYPREYPLDSVLTH